ncbi:hypothetical protein [Actinacidiphila sp. bgisy160]|uniref:hypothetical protein n=1 Tax=Actinacidiphila sp. bgisy160 TaxID=3413796 RepID=UPI003D730E8A
MTVAELLHAAPAAAVPEGLAEAFAARTRPTEDGHRMWARRVEKCHPAGRFRHKGRDYTAQQAAFLLRTGRMPVGYIRPWCEVPSCCEPEHVEDAETRQRDRTAYAGITGVRHRPWSCDHDPDTEARVRGDGRRYCHACNRASRTRP